MPWFENDSSAATGKWGQHWTMANRNPNKFLPDGRREIASYYYPLIGPYASSDPDVIDYHLLLMKYSGIDGVIADWYGTQNIYDYPLMKRNTDSLFNRIQGTGLQFAVCYEDAVLPKVKMATGIGIITAARKDFQFLDSAYFNNAAYIKVNSQPLMLCFGTSALRSPWDWQQALSVLTIKPTLLTLWYRREDAGYLSAGEFPWIDSNHLISLQKYYAQRRHQYFTSVAGAYPGFKDFYKQGGWGRNLFIIDHQATHTLQQTLALAAKSGSSILQLTTWNDFGEGTMLEPTLEFNFSFLEIIQQYAGVIYSKKELMLIYRWFLLKKKYKADPLARKKLQTAYYLLLSLDPAGAEKIISGTW